jgi:hypothetical protein
MNYVSLAHFPSNTQVQLCILKQFRDPLPDLPLSRSGPLTIILEPIRKVILWLLGGGGGAPPNTKTTGVLWVFIFLDLRNF